MRSLPTRLDGPLLLETAIHGDDRGFFMETFRASVLHELGVEDEWVQDNHSRSRRGVVRGMHLQPGMSKLVRCARGTILDVLVDARPDSPQYGRWEAYELSDRNGRMIYAPDGFGHGFCVVSQEADVVYKCSAYYDGSAERAFAFDDPAVAVEWPEGLELVPSARDRAAGPLAQLAAG
jgi:dTDP-4-dehydrorhamnose 3,5-epimerase